VPDSLNENVCVEFEHLAIGHTGDFERESKSFMNEKYPHPQKAPIAI
jgi:hypothetical protein